MILKVENQSSLQKFSSFHSLVKSFQCYSIKFFFISLTLFRKLSISYTEL